MIIKMWPTSEQTACTFTGGISVLRQNTLDFGNESVGDSCSALLAGDLFLRISPEQSLSTWPSLLRLHGTGYNHSTVFLAHHHSLLHLEISNSVVFEHLHPFKGDQTWKQQCLCNVRMRTLEGRMFYLLVSHVKRGSRQ